jgi:hypothetical protein
MGGVKPDITAQELAADASVQRLYYTMGGQSVLERLRLARFI